MDSAEDAKIAQKVMVLGKATANAVRVPEERQAALQPAGLRDLPIREFATAGQSDESPHCIQDSKLID